MSCFCPAHFTGAHVEYTNNICLISHSFYVAVDKTKIWPLPNTNMKKEQMQQLPILSNKTTTNSINMDKTNEKFFWSKLVNLNIGKEFLTLKWLFHNNCVTVILSLEL